MTHRTTRAVSIGLASAFFFTLTYVLNRAAAVDGGHWAWTASLRYLLTMPMLALVMGARGGARPVLVAMRRRPGPWFVWSAVGFVIFYLGLAGAAASGPSWLVAAGFQLTVVAGVLLAPLLYDDGRRHIPPRALGVGLTIVAGIALMQLGHFREGFDSSAWIAIGCVVVSAFTYPLGNRRMLLHLEREGVALGALQRVFGMTLASMPLWILVAAYAWWVAGPPPLEHVLLAAGVALSAGVIATALFFEATGRVQGDPVGLAAVEAMQGAVLLFASLMGTLFLGEPWPAGWALVGAVVVVAGLAAFAMVGAAPRSPRPVPPPAPAAGELRASESDAPTGGRSD